MCANLIKLTLLFIITPLIRSADYPIDTCSLQSSCLEVEFRDNNDDNVPDLMCLRFVDGEDCQKTNIGDPTECLSWGCVNNQDTLNGFCSDVTYLCVDVDCTVPSEQQFGTFLVEDNNNSNNIIGNICGTFNDELSIFGSSTSNIIAECKASDSTCENNECGGKSCLSSCAWNIDYSATCSSATHGSNVVSVSSNAISTNMWLIIVFLAFIMGMAVGVLGVSGFTLYQNREEPITCQDCDCMNRCSRRCTGMECSHWVKQYSDWAKDRLEQGVCSWHFGEKEATKQSEDPCEITEIVIEKEYDTNTPVRMPIGNMSPRSEGKPSESDSEVSRNSVSNETCATTISALSKLQSYNSGSYIE